MNKTLLYRLFGFGKIPQDAMDQLQREGVVLQDEGIGGSVTFKRFRAPGRYYGWKRSWFSGSVVLTQEHFLAFKYSQPIIGVSWGHEKLRELDVWVEDESTFCVRFEASTFQENTSGEVEVRFSTTLARALLKEVERHTTERK